MKLLINLKPNTRTFVYNIIHSYNKFNKLYARATGPKTKLWRGKIGQKELQHAALPYMKNMNDDINIKTQFAIWLERDRYHGKSLYDDKNQRLSYSNFFFFRFGHCIIRRTKIKAKKNLIYKKLTYLYKFFSRRSPFSLIFA